MEREFKDMKECFQIRPIDESGEKCIITIGNHLATEEVFKSRKAAEMRINKTDWNLVSAFFFAMKEAIEHEKKLKEQESESKLMGNRANVLKDQHLKTEE